MKIIITLICIIISTYLFGQSNTNSKSNNALLKEFSGFLDKFCKEESDSILNFNDSLMKYSVVFTSEGYFIDPKNDLIRLCNLKNIKRENYSAEVVHLKNVPDSLRSYFNGYSCQPIKTCIINSCLEEPLEDSIVNIQSESTFQASCVCAKEIKFSKEISMSNVFSSINNQNTFETPSVISYQSGKYLIIDIMLVTQIGIQIDSGFILTFYLERID